MKHRSRLGRGVRAAELPDVVNIGAELAGGIRHDRLEGDCGMVGADRDLFTGVKIRAIQLIGEVEVKWVGKPPGFEERWPVGGQRLWWRNGGSRHGLRLWSRDCLGRCHGGEKARDAQSEDSNYRQAMAHSYASSVECSTTPLTYSMNGLRSLVVTWTYSQKIEPGRDDSSLPGSRAGRILCVSSPH